MGDAQGGNYRDVGYGHIILVITFVECFRRTSSKEARIKEYLEAFQVPDLTAQEIQAIDDAGAKLHKRIFMRHVFGE